MKMPVDNIGNLLIKYGLQTSSKINAHIFDENARLRNLAPPSKKPMASMLIVYLRLLHISKYSGRYVNALARYPSPRHGRSATPLLCSRSQNLYKPTQTRKRTEIEFRHVRELSSFSTRTSSCANTR